MRRLVTHEEFQKEPLPSGVRGALAHALTTEHSLSNPHPYDPEDGTVWLLERGDTDATVTAALGASLEALSFDGVDRRTGEYFLCHLVRSNSRCDTLVVPDEEWLPPAWRQNLLRQI
jgi:hypothetical protein